MSLRIQQIQSSLQTIFKVARKPKYAIVIMVVAMLLVCFFIWLPNRVLLWQQLFDMSLTIGEKINLFVVLLGGFMTNFDLFDRVSMITLGLLMGINVALVTYYCRRTFRIQKSAGTSIIGIVIGMFGIGCSACGSVLLSSVFGVGIGTVIMGLLPWHGMEFFMISLVILVGSTLYIAYKIEQPLVCGIKVPRKEQIK